MQTNFVNKVDRAKEIGNNSITRKRKFYLISPGISGVFSFSLFTSSLKAIKIIINKQTGDQKCL